MPASAVVWYTELRGEDAQDQLTVFLELLSTQPGFLGAELLGSPAQPGLFLVASRWAQQVPAVEVPGGAKAWSFEVLAAR